MKKKFCCILLLVLILMAVIVTACNNSGGNGNPDPKVIGWDGKSVTYTAQEIKSFGSGTPAGTVSYNSCDDEIAIWNIDTSLDNYGGIQTPMLTLDFSKAVIFKMDVVSCYSQYIVKLAVQGESEYYYVLSDEGTTGEVSINVVDAMLCDKYRGKNTQPDPGYQNGWKYNGQKKNCCFHILAKGPDGEQQTAELVIKSIAVFNDETAVTGVTVDSDALSGNKLIALKNSTPVTLGATVLPSAVSDKRVTWKSLDESIATVDASGVVNFVGVGKTQIVATSKVDQSKSKSIDVDVRSGFEQANALVTKLNSLTFGGSSTDVAIYNDLFNTSWTSDEDMSQRLTASNLSAVNVRIAGNSVYAHNYFDVDNAAHVSECNSLAVGDKAYFSLTLENGVGATVYRNIGGKLYKEVCDGAIKVQYLEKVSGAWEKAPSYRESIIVVYGNGTVKKAAIRIDSSVKIAQYNASDFANSSLWTIPDRTKQQENAVVHALSRASVRVEGDLAVLKQNKYTEAKYCFGGIVSNVFTVDKNKEVEVVLDVAELNKMNDYVKTMWEIKVVYYYDDKVTAVSANPIKVMSGNIAGVQSFRFTPAYDDFVIYLVVNGSDIGAQFDGAEMKIRSLQIYSID